VNSPMDGTVALPPLPELIAQCARGEVGAARERAERYLSDHPHHPIATFALKLMVAGPDYATLSEIAASELSTTTIGPDELGRLGSRLAACQGMSEVATAALETAGEMDYIASGTLDPLGGPFNGQLNRKLLFDEIIAKLEIEAIVETGSYRASTTEYMAGATGLPVFSCEIEPRLFAYCRRRLEALPNALVARQDSTAFLKSALWDGRLRGRRVFFYLDAHWYENLPLREEVRLILGADLDPVIMIDDFAVPGEPRYGFDDYGPGKVLRIEYLLHFVEAGLSYFFPSLPADRETGKQRGCVVACRRPTDELLGARVEGLFRLSWRDAILAHLQEPHDVLAESMTWRSAQSEKGKEVAILTGELQQLADQVDKLTRHKEETQLRIEETQQRIEEKDSEIATLTGIRQQQADLLSKLAYSNEELHAQVRELLASRWRKLGRRLGIAKAASFEE
jgi:hypothetical protein